MSECQEVSFKSTGTNSLLALNSTNHSPSCLASFLIYHSVFGLLSNRFDTWKVELSEVVAAVTVKVGCSMVLSGVESMLTVVAGAGTNVSLS